jgi:hypothetical protein
MVTPLAPSTERTTPWAEAMAKKAETIARECILKVVWIKKGLLKVVLLKLSRQG